MGAGILVEEKEHASGNYDERKGEILFFFLSFLFFSPQERFDGYYFSMVLFLFPDKFFLSRIFPFRGYNVKLEATL